MTADDVVVDVIFSLRGSAVARDYAWRLWQGLRQRLMWLDEERAVGIHPLSGVSGSEGVLYLNRRARLILRLPQRLAEAARMLDGLALDLGGEVVVEGGGSLRPLRHAAVLYAPFVCVGSDDEGEFLAECRRRLPSSSAQLICGKARSATLAEDTVRGYSLMLHGLDATESLRLLSEGLGEQRKLGCGIFVPHKSVAAVGS